ncbi:hypothetical protein MRS76_25705 [Rhizobiaceae bacterium n13]|uniref:hypothetical protein n=1 Tax=Ferirhizobium litorale TaxID=2927786 RepID=UPI0024B2B299|nr:hypothetical protein [Fererhizobium litorale]MDI7865294.1 hypothetical protein [Fererhizobium litorale]
MPQKFMNPGVFQQFRNLFELLRGGKIPIPIISAFPPDHCLPTGSIGQEIVKDNDYFSILVNELFLAQDRQWWATYDPVVLVISEFIYDKDKIVVPKIVGPSMIESQFGKLPLGLVLNDTCVVGPYPFRGGRISISVVLYRVRHASYARELLRLVEQISGAIGVPADAGTLSKVGGMILDGMESLMGLGDTEPVVGHRIELDGNRLQGLRSSSTVLSTAEASDLPSLWVDAGRLRTGKVGEGTSSFTSADYVLYTVQKHESRGEERSLPFYELYEQALKSAAVLDENGESWKQAKMSLLSLYQQLIVSPDVTANEADILFDKFTEDLKKKKMYIEKARNLGGEAEGHVSKQGRKLSAAMSILDNI